MAQHKKKIPRDKALPLIALEAAGQHISRNEWQEAGGAQRDYKDFVALGRMKSEEFNSLLRERMQTVAAKLASKLEERLDSPELEKIPVKDLAIAFGIFKDKLNLDSGKDEVKNLNMTQINIGDASKASRDLLIKAIFGQNSEPLEVAKPISKPDMAEEIPAPEAPQAKA